MHEGIIFMFQKTVESVQVEFNHAHLLLYSLATFDFKTAE